VTVDVGEPQAPFWQVSPEVHALPSLQGVPFGWYAFGQTSEDPVQ
jgi:hypothetical protein